MSLFLNMACSSLVKCIKRISPVVNCKNILTKNLNQPKTFWKFKQSSIIRHIYLPNSTTLTKSILYGFSLLGLFGLDEDVDSELKLINTIKRGILYLQVKYYNYDYY